MPRIEANIDKMALFDKVGYKPHSAGQQAFHDSPARFRIACCGRRYGKSFMEGHELTCKMFVPDSINWIVGPKYSLGEKEFKVVWNDFKALGLMPYCKTRYSLAPQWTMRIEFPEMGSILEVKSAEKPDTLVGEGVDHVCMSEAAKHKRATWEMYIRPALQDKHGSADFPSTPQGFNWFKGLYDLGQNTDNPVTEDFASWRFPSWENKAIFPGGREDPEILAVEEEVSSIFFAQEIAAEFSSFEGQVYPEFDPKIHVKEFEYNPNWKNWLAFDFGYTAPTVCLDIMIDSENRIYIWREYVESHRSTVDHGLIIKRRENPIGYHVDAICADPRGPDQIATLTPILGSILCNAIGTDLGIEEIKKLMKIRPDGTSGITIHPRCQVTINEFKSLEAKPDKHGNIIISDENNHCCDATRYFVNEYFVLGMNSSLKDLYGTAYNNSEAQSFFTYHGGIDMGMRF